MCRGPVYTRSSFPCDPATRFSGEEQPSALACLRPANPGHVRTQTGAQGRRGTKKVRPGCPDANHVLPPLGAMQLPQIPGNTDTASLPRTSATGVSALGTAQGARPAQEPSRTAVALKPRGKPAAWCDLARGGTRRKGSGFGDQLRTRSPAPGRNRPVPMELQTHVHISVLTKAES